MKLVKTLLNNFTTNVTNLANLLLGLLAFVKSRLSRQIFGDDDVEIVEAESVDPDSPLETGEEAEAQEPRTFREKVKAWYARKKVEIYQFFVPPPIMVPAQLQTPEIDLDDHIKEQPLKGQLIYALIIAFFTILVMWAGFSEIDELVRAEGEVVPSDSVQVVQSRLPGSVVAIHVKLDDRVNKGDVLFEVEDEDVQANFDDNEIHRLTSLATIQRLEAESAKADMVSFPPELEAAAPEIVAQERAVFISRRQALESEQDVIEQEIESLRRGIAERNAEARQAKLQIGTIEEERKVIAPLVDKGYEPRLTLLNIEARLNDAKGRLELATLGADRMESDLETQSRRLASLETRFQADADAQLVEIKTRAAQTKARLDALREKVAFTKIRAPEDGIVSAVHVNTIGAVVDGGAMVAEIVPVEDEVTIRARVNTDDVSKVAPGQKVNVTITSYDVSRYGQLEGIVDKVASNSTQDQNVPPYFVTMIKVPDPTFGKSGLEPEIVPGTPVVVDMIAGKRTILGYILSPINRAQTIVFKEK